MYFIGKMFSLQLVDRENRYPSLIEKAFTGKSSTPPPPNAPIY